MLLNLPEPDLSLLERIRIHPSSSKYSTKTLISSGMQKTSISAVLRLLYDSLYLKNDVNVPSKSNKQKTWRNNIFCWHLEGH
jgi:putative component of membrane protein insertase Oxa1/YidC/SpoIIIJ protein YidD